MQYIVYRTNSKITHFHEARKVNTETRPLADLIYDYNVKHVEKGEIAELVEVEENSFVEYLINTLANKEATWEREIDNMVDSLEDVISFLQRLKYE